MFYDHTIPSMSIGGVESIPHRKSSREQSGPGCGIIQIMQIINIKGTKDIPVLV